MEDRAEKLRRLKDVPISSIVSYLGMETKAAGSTIFVHCPSPEHNDKKPSAYFKTGDRSIWCNVCHQQFGAIDTIIGVRGGSVEEAINTLWEIQGCPDWFRSEYKPKQGLKKQAPPFKLDMEDAEKIRIKYPGALMAPINVSNTPEIFKDGDYSCIKMGKSYVAFKPYFSHYNDFLSSREYFFLARNMKKKQLKQLYDMGAFLKENKDKSPMENPEVKALQESTKLLYEDVFNIKLEEPKA